MTADEASDLSESVVAEVEESLSGGGRRSRELYTLIRRRVRQLPQIAGRSRRAEAVSVALTSGPSSPSIAPYGT
jgi:hypothetical protein